MKGIPLSRPSFWSNLWHVLIEISDGIRNIGHWHLRKRLTKLETKKERAKRFDDWKQVLNDILQRSQSDLWEGSRPEAKGLQRSFFLHLESESQRLETAGSAVALQNSKQGIYSHIGGWAAHFLPVEEFENLYVESVSLGVERSAEAMMYAWRSVAHFRDFPRLVAYQIRCLSENYLGGVEDAEARTETLYRTRANISADLDRDLEKGRKASLAFEKKEIGEYEEFAYRRYFEFVESETIRAKTEFDDEELRDQYGKEVKIHGWATHFLTNGAGLSSRDYQAFYARTIIANRQLEVLAARRALRAARVLPAFPPYEGLFEVCARPRSLR